jgi:hypothetical protein
MAYHARLNAVSEVLVLLVREILKALHGGLGGRGLVEETLADLGAERNAYMLSSSSACEQEPKCHGDRCRC